LTHQRELIQFISTHPFDRTADELLDDDDIRHVQLLLQDTPEAGVVVPGTGGLRKLRIGLDGRGKRGGGRLLYLYVHIRGVIYFVAVYAKKDQGDITPAAYRMLARIVEQLKEET
jgi:hypothetical protein